MNAEENLYQKISELERTVLTLREQSVGTGSYEKDARQQETQKNYKDRLFKFIFGNPENR